jgi:hypothetical protein
MLVKELNLTNFKREFEDYFTAEGAEMLYSYLAEAFAYEDEYRLIDEATIKGQFDFILKDDMEDYKEEELNIIDVGFTGVLVEW